MRSAVFGSFCGGFLAVLCAVATASPAFAQTTVSKSSTAKKSKDLSDRSVRVLQSFAWQIMPSEYETKKGKKIKVTGVDPKKFMIPVQDARRVIVAARRSAYAQICELPEHQAANYQRLMASEQNLKKWSPEQLLFINRLHLFTVMWLTGNVKIGDAAGKETKESVKKKLKDAAKTPAQQTCSDAQREQVRQQIETYVKAAEKS